MSPVWSRRSACQPSVSRLIGSSPPGQFQGSQMRPGKSTSVYFLFNISCIIILKPSPFKQVTKCSCWLLSSMYEDWILCIDLLWQEWPAASLQEQQLPHSASSVSLVKLSQLSRRDLDVGVETSGRRERESKRKRKKTEYEDDDYEEPHRIRQGYLFFILHRTRSDAMYWICALSQSHLSWRDTVGIQRVADLFKTKAGPDSEQIREVVPTIKEQVILEG